MNTRENTLKTINETLNNANLKSLHKLGDRKNGEFEIIGIKEIYTHSSRFFTDVKFDVLLLGDKPAEFTVRFNANGLVSDGTVTVVLINGRFAIVKQWRTPLGKWTYEISRGFNPKAEKAAHEATLGALSFQDFTIPILKGLYRDKVLHSASYLGCIAENSGTHNVSPSYFLLELQVPERVTVPDIFSCSDQLRVELWDRERVMSELGGKLSDNHSIVAVCLANKHLADRAKL
jgi:hypothetical protein